MLSENLIRNAIQAVSMPVNEMTFSKAKNSSEKIIETLTYNYQDLITQEFVLNAGSPEFTEEDQKTILKVAYTQATYTYQHVLQIVITPESTLDIRHNRTEILRGRKNIYGFLGDAPSLQSVESALMLAVGQLPVARSSENPLDLLEAESQVYFETHLQSFIPQLLKLTRLRFGNALPESIAETYSWIHTAFRQRLDEIHNEAFKFSDTYKPDSPYSSDSKVSDLLWDVEELYLWKTLQEKLVQALALHIETPLEHLMGLPRSLSEFIAGAFDTDGTNPDAIDLLKTAQHYYALAQVAQLNSEQRTWDLQHSDLAIHSQLYLQNPVEESKLSKDQLQMVNYTNEYFLQNLFIEKSEQSEWEVPTPDEFKLLYTQAQTRCELYERELAQADENFAMSYESELYEEYLIQVDDAIRDQYGDFFFEESSPEEIKDMREAIMETVPFEDFTP